MELVIEGNVFFEGKVQKLALGIEDGLIVEIKKTMKGGRVLDFGDKLVFPGAIDAHVHFRDPGQNEKEDFLSGTTAAACGGVTTVMDMPNTRPPTVWATDVHDKLSLAGKKACVDVGLFAGLAGKGRPEKLAPLVLGYKLYMGSSTGDLLFDDYSGLKDLLAPLAATGLPVAVHAEHEEMLRSMKVVPRDTITYNDARPPECEVEAVRTFLSSVGDCRGHICHISTRGALEAVGAGQKDAQEVKKATCEVTPHHLLLDARESAALGTKGKVNPPLRRMAEREALWSAFLSGGIDMLASDHAPHLEEDKDTRFEDAPAGVPGVETMVPLMMLLVKRCRLEPARLAEVACQRPAEVYSIHAGRIAKGMPAHLAVYDLRNVKEIRGKNLNSKCAWTPFQGREAIFPKAVFLRGVQIVDEGEPIVSPGSGKLLPSVKKAQ